MNTKLTSPYLQVVLPHNIAYDALVDSLNSINAHDLIGVISYILVQRLDPHERLIVLSEIAETVLPKDLKQNG